jgi:hypothetical protein
MVAILTVIKLLLSIAPDLVALIKKLEELWPDGGLGKAKLSIIKEYMAGAWTVAEGVLPDFEKVWNKVETIISGVISILNTAGIFKKTE